ncbi:MAG: hypothetical protein IKE10_03195 [Bacilli bacterium]|nr:hypothetical protein [Bacilli bacterium]
MTKDRITFNKKLQNEKEYKAFIDHDGNFETINVPYDIDNPEGAFNTEDTITQMEDYMRKSMKLLSRNGIPFDKVALTTDVGFLCKKSFVDRITTISKRLNVLRGYLPREEEEQKEIENLQEDIYYLIYSSLVSSFDKVYVPVDFRLNLEKSSFSSEGQDNIGKDYTKTYQEIDDFIKNNSVEGIVDLRRFIDTLTKYGYLVRSNDRRNNGHFRNVENYLLSYIRGYDKNSCKTSTKLTVVADLSTDKRLTYKSKEKDNN